MFISPNFTFNGKYSRDFGISIATFEDNIFNELGTEYTEEIEMEHGDTEYNPYYTRSVAEAKDIELNLLMYNPSTMTPLKLEDCDLEDVYDWLITDDFVSFISDDDPEIIYYFKVVNIVKNFTFSREGYLTVTFKPYSNYVYKRVVYNNTIKNTTIITDIYNQSREDYAPIIEVTNLGDSSTVNSIGDLTLTGLNNGEKVIVDNLTRLVQLEDGTNKFNCCNRKFLKLDKRKTNSIRLSGNMSIRIICEFPLLQ